MRRVTCTLGLWIAVVAPALAQAPAPSGAPRRPPAPAVATGDYVFRASTGLLIFHVRPEAARDFEAVLARVEQGLDAATDVGRKQQRAGSRLFQSTDAPAGAALYVWLADPVVAGADYDPVRMITELLPGESQALYERLKAAVLKVERMSLAPVR